MRSLNIILVVFFDVGLTGHVKEHHHFGVQLPILSQPHTQHRFAASSFSGPKTCTLRDSKSVSWKLILSHCKQKRPAVFFSEGSTDVAVNFNGDPPEK